MSINPLMIDFPEEFHTQRLTSFTGQGYAAEAVRGIADFAFSTLKARRVEIHVDPRNQRSWKVAERLGFQLEGVLRNYARDAKGELRDTRVYALVR